MSGSATKAAKPQCPDTFCRKLVLQELPIAIVIPWFGEDLKGGAEQHAWQVATRLGARGVSVEVLTTCCKSFADDWAENHLPEGITCTAGIAIRRFPVNPRARSAFDSVNRKLLGQSQLLTGVSPIDSYQERIWINENINSDALELYLRESATAYRCFLFIPYLYGIIIRGLPLVAERALLQPCLHDEAYAYLPAVGSIVSGAQRLLFLSLGEMELASRLYGPSVLMKGCVVGAGVEGGGEENLSSTPSPVSRKRFVLCLGRRCKEKGTDDLIFAYQRFRLRTPNSDLLLVLAGPGERSYGDEASGIIDLGLVSDEQRTALISHSVALCQPSKNESFSRVLYEAWQCGKPAVVHKHCLATSRAVETSGGGWTAATADQWAEIIATVDSAPPDELQSVGHRGAGYARELANWDLVLNRYEQAFSLVSSANPGDTSARVMGTVHQLLPNLAPGDAISNQALWIQAQLRSIGCVSELLVARADEEVRDLCRTYDASLLGSDDGLIYHHSIGSQTTDTAITHPGSKWLIYHNVTPEQFFMPYDKEHALLLRDGREQMWSLARAFPHAVGDSQYNSDELRMHGFRSTGVLPIAVDPSKWSVSSDPAIMKALQDGRRNILYVGRFAPNKCQHDLIAAFAHYVELDSDSRLILIGKCDSRDAYFRQILELIAFLELQDHIVLPGHVTQLELNSYFRTASLYWSMSEHEGFCVPLVEAMWFDIPILAFRAGAIPETLDGAGIMFDDKSDLHVVAELAANIKEHQEFAESVVSRQRRRRVDFLPDIVRRSLFQTLSRQ